MFSKNILSIDIGTYYTKMVLGRYKNNALIIDDAFFVRTPSNVLHDGQVTDITKLKEIISETLKVRKTKADKVVFTLESTSIITRELLLPAVKQKDFEEMLGYEVQQYFPTTLEDYVIQYKKLEDVNEDGIKKRRILVGALPKVVVQNYYELTKALKLKPFALDIHSNAVTKLLHKKVKINENEIEENQTVAFIDLGYESINVNIIQDGSYRFSRLITIGGKDIDMNIANSFDLSIEDVEKKKREIKISSSTDENPTTSIILEDLVQSSVDQWIAEIQRIFKFYTSRNLGNKIDKIYLYGGHANLDGIVQYFEAFFDLPTFKVDTISSVKLKSQKNDFHMGYYLNTMGAIIRR